MDRIGPWGWSYGHPLPAELDNCIKFYLEPANGESIVWAKKNLGLELANVIPQDGVTKGYFTSDLTQ